MARFILDVANCNENDIKKVLNLVETTFLSSTVCRIACIDETNENQFHDSMEDQLSTKQIDNFKKSLEESYF